MYPIIDVIKTGQRIKELMLSHHLTPIDIQKYLSLSCVQSVYRWLNGVSVPSIDHLYALSELFQVSIDEMIVGSKDNQPFIIKEPITYYFYCH